MTVDLTPWLPRGRALVAAALLIFIAPALQAAAPATLAPVDITDANPPAAAACEAELLTNVRQLTFAGRRAGEGYFSADGQRMIFQSEREPGNPFFQIYLMDLGSGDVRRVSPGYGKTTCSWIHPSGRKVLFASTQDDPQARQKQADELRRRREGPPRRYSWDYDENFDIYEYDLAGGQYRNLTHTRGYDAEGSWSPDGRLIAFASNRRGYAEGLSEEERKRFAVDPSYLIDIYRMNADGSDVRRLTDAPGYDGGPFFSPDGRRICWRHFAPSGATAEIMTMNVDGSDQRQLTHLGAMSWAPYYHPSGQYLIFTTNRHGMANFELYLVDAAGRSPPVRVTYSKGFDGLPVFSPDGRHLAWTTNRHGGDQSQIFLADWNDEKARQLLGLAVRDGEVGSQFPSPRPSPGGRGGPAAVRLQQTVAYLCRPELEGRLTGTPGEQQATAYVADRFEQIGLQPAGDGGTFFQQFPFTAGVALGQANRLAWGPRTYKLDADWRPAAFSQTGPVAAAPVVFAGYGLRAPAAEGQPAYDSYAHPDVAGHWVLVLRYLPDDVSPQRRQQLAPYSNLRFKAMLARDKRARGLIVVNGPNAHAKTPLLPLQFDGSLSGSSLPVLSVTDAVADGWLAASGKSLKQLQDQLDRGEASAGFAVPGVELAADIDIRHIDRVGRNVLARLPAGPAPSQQVVVIGAHVDHLGRGLSSASLARDDEKDGIHFGADDNASGVAALLEVARRLTAQKAAGQLTIRRDILLAAWSGEELGLLGSAYFVKTYGGSAAAGRSLYPGVAVCLNMDMVGRLRQQLILQGIGSSSIWRREVDRSNAPLGLPIALSDESYLPTDASSFYLHGVPILAAFTGSHPEYHTPRDTPEKLNYPGMAQVARFMAAMTAALAQRPDPPDYQSQPAPARGPARSNLRVYLGTIPDYAADVHGVKLTGVVKDGPAARAGLQPGDVIVELSGRKLDNIYDYMYALEGLKSGVKAPLVIRRNGQRTPLEITPAARD